MEQYFDFDSSLTSRSLGLLAVYDINIINTTLREIEDELKNDMNLEIVEEGIYCITLPYSHLNLYIFKKTANPKQNIHDFHNIIVNYHTKLELFYEESQTIASPERRRPGRPTSNPKNSSFRVRLDNETLEMLRVVSERMKISKSEVIREIIRKQYLEIKSQ